VGDVPIFESDRQQLLEDTEFSAMPVRLTGKQKPPPGLEMPVDYPPGLEAPPPPAPVELPNLDEQRLARKAAREATHALTHFPADANCEICRICKQRRQPAKTIPESKKTKLTKMYQNVSFDHIEVGRLGLCEGHDGSKCALFIQDDFSRMCNVEGLKSHQTVEAADAIRQFLGPELPQVRCLSSDSAPVFKRLAKLLRLPHRTGTPRRPTSNHHERFIEIVGDSARCMLHQAGLEQEFWPLACSTWCNAYNATHIQTALGNESAHGFKYPNRPLPQIQPFGRN
jgi:hypothetical protein